jgi:hypothetical protein
MQSSEGTVTFKCEGCGVRKPEAERYLPRSAFTVCSPACLDAAQTRLTGDGLIDKKPAVG